MAIKETRHPDGCIDLRIVPFSMVVEGKMLDRINSQILKDFGSDMLLNSKHHILIVDMGEKDEH